MDDQPCARRRQRAWGSQIELRGHAMQPNHKFTPPNFCVNGLAFGIALNTARGKAKRLDEKVVFDLNVLAHQDCE